MRAAIAVLMLALVGLAGAAREVKAQSGRATLQGRIVAAGTAAPVAGALVIALRSFPPASTLSAIDAARLETLSFNLAATSGNAPDVFATVVTHLEAAMGMVPDTLLNTLAQRAAGSVLSDLNGYFAFPNLAAGNYSLRATHDGYFGPLRNGSASSGVVANVSIGSSPAPAPIELRLTPPAVISGTIRGPDGQLAAGIGIAAYQIFQYVDGHPKWKIAGPIRMSNDRGEYRLYDLAPGTYFAGTAKDTKRIEGPRDGWARTFFPGVADPAAARSISLESGGEVRRIDFNIQAAPPTFTISGTALNPLATPNSLTGVASTAVNTFVLMPRDHESPDPTPSNVGNSILQADKAGNRFEIRNVAAGVYDLFPLYYAPDSQRYYTGPVTVDVRSGDASGVNLVIEKGFTVSGQVVQQGSGPRMDLSGLSVGFAARDSLPAQFASAIGILPVHDSGQFMAQDAPRALYTIEVHGLSDSEYVADVLLDGKSVRDSGLRIGVEQVQAIQVIVRSDGGTVQGNVHTGASNIGADATVVLAPAVVRRGNSSAFLKTTSDAAGNFEFESVPPGDYTAYAWESILPGSWTNAEILSKYSWGAAVHVDPAGRSSITLEWIPGGQ